MVNEPTHPFSLRRRLSFVEHSTLFHHNTSQDTADENSGIGGPSTATIATTTDNNPQLHDSQSAVIGAHKHKHKHPHKHQKGPTPTEQESTSNSVSVFDGFQVTQVTQPPGVFNGFGITQQTSPPGFFDGFQVDNSVPAATATASNEFPNQGTFSNLTQVQNTPVPYKQIFLCVGLSLACVILGLCYWRNTFVIHKRTKTKRQMAKLKQKQQTEQQIAEQRKQAKMNHLKRLYEDFEKHKAELAVDPIQGDNVLSPTYSPKRLVAIHMGDNAHHKIEKIDFIEDIEFGQELSQSHSEDDCPALTMRMVKRNSSTEEHWIQYSSYSSDETTTESDTSNSEDHHHNNNH